MAFLLKPKPSLIDAPIDNIEHHIAVPNPNSQNKPKPQLKGIGGWLLMLIVGMCFFTPLVDTLQIGAMVREAYRWSEIAKVPLSAKWGHSIELAWAFVIVSNVIRISGGLALIFSRRKKAIMTAIMAIWLAGPVSLVAFANLSNMKVGTMAMFALGQATLYATLWSLYLLKSKRVKNTYVKD